MSLSDVLTIIHIVAAMTWLGGAFLAAVFGTRMKKAEPAHALGFARDMSMVSQRVFMPAAIVVLASGVWLVLDSNVYDLEQAWILIGFAAVAITAGLGPAFFKPTLARGIAAMEAGNGPEAGATMKRLAMVSRISIVIQFIAVWAMVVKPGV